MKKLRVAVVGAGGRMGRELLSAIQGSKQLEPFLALSAKPVAGFKYTVSSLLMIKQKQMPDVLIDFSSPSATANVAKWCAKHRVPLVCGTTGLSTNDMKSLRLAAKKTAVLWSANMSLGVAVLKKALQAFSAIRDYDFEMVELHHNKKKDNPSGTAVSLQKELEQIIKKKVSTAHGLRGGGVFGVHQVYALGDEEVLMFEHQALNRAVFAKGALVAARWLVHKKQGFYCIENVLWGEA